MDPEFFLLEMLEREECQSIIYKRLAIQESMGFYFSRHKSGDAIDSFLIPFRDITKKYLIENSVDIDELVSYMIANDKSGWTHYALTTKFKPKEDMSFLQYCAVLSACEGFTHYVDVVDMDIVALIVVSFILDNLQPSSIDIGQIVKKECFIYPINQYGLTNVTGATFKKDGLIFDHKGYYYNMFTNKTLLAAMDSVPGFVKIIQEETTGCDFLYRLDEQLSMPEEEYYDYTGVAFAKFYGPQFRFAGKTLRDSKTTIVHIDDVTLDKLLMVVKRCMDNESREFWHVEIETLPYRDSVTHNVITTFLHGMYYPERGIFTHVDYTKNQYSGREYFQKYSESVDGLPIDQYTSSKDLHYKIWCIENGEIEITTWYKLMIISLTDRYQVLLNEMLR